MQVLSDRHSYKEISCDEAPHLHGLHKVASTCFSPPARQYARYSFSKIQQTDKDTKAWHSPGVAQLAASTADLEICRQARESGGLAMASQAWLACLFSGQDMLVKAPHSDQWMFSLTPCNNIGIFWPADEKNFLDGSTYFVPRTEPGTKHILKAMTAYQNWKARSVSWCSPWRQLLNGYGTSEQIGGQTARTVGVAGPEQDILEFAARHAFWQLPKTTLDMLCRKKGIDAGSTLFDSLCKLIKSIIAGLTDEQLADILRLRVASSPKHDHFAMEILQLDSFMDCLDREEHEQLVKEQRRIKEQVVSEGDTFENEVLALSAKAKGFKNGKAPHPP